MVIINEKRKKNQHKLMKDERKPFFFYVGFLSQTFTNYKTAGKGDGISLAPHYYFHPIHRYLDISQMIAAESSPLLIASSWTRTRNLWFPSTSH